VLAWISIAAKVGAYRAAPLLPRCFEGHQKGVRKGKSDQQGDKQIQRKCAKGGCADKVNLGVAYAHNGHYRRIARAGERNIFYILITKR
jgi:hypothetical protein